ncbi:Crp/Fnr family transcriptional regulator [Maribacter sp. PR1]|uniref:Crp/Fnr family transcriptional regulator n=1 Tax=Maribacter cobaltidurans TaxID=1178778 RepID=A0ABU7IY79_9FLAO|nr:MULTISPECIES: Crp/Fnr family transcriptional regulator [Maribacter]MDC6390556.1 Crp/Fnr family transcriptional regulator [Maribacter sp. PR1]MEE1977947.1 Crp/Fnr family transcriptional regulator [Maribacter cobaltidurans]
MNNNLSSYIKRYIELTEEENELFQSFLKNTVLKKGDFLLKAGQTCTAKYFVVKGCVRLYYIDGKGNEQIIHFGLDNWWITEYDSLINKNPSNIYIQAIEDTLLLTLNQTSFEKLTLEIPKINTLFRIIMEKTFIASQRRLEYMLSYSGKELYQKFVSQNPEFLQRVPQYVIASYLGMTPEFYSKIRSNTI